MDAHWHFTSGDEVIEVEVRGVDTSEPELVFLNHDIQYDYAMIEMGLPPTTAYLLWYLWHEYEGELFQICYINEEFYDKQPKKWQRLGDTDARAILAVSRDGLDTGYIAAKGSDFLFDQRVFMATAKGRELHVRNFLQYYEGDVLSDERLELESMLSPEEKYVLAVRSEVYTRENKIRLVLESTDADKVQAFRDLYDVMTPGDRTMVLDSIENERRLAEALYIAPALPSNVAARQLLRIKDHLLREETVNRCALNKTWDWRRAIAEGREP